MGEGGREAYSLIALRWVEWSQCLRFERKLGLTVPFWVVVGFKGWDGMECVFIVLV